jgi:SAM-dependent methyltransferase
MEKKTQALAETLRSLVLQPEDCIRRILVVGCGDGEEAADLADFFDCDVDAIDVQDYFRVRHQKVTFQQMDARELRFDDDAFDIVWSFHAVEHIPQPERAMAEMRRVLRPGGAFMIGVPNRSRIVGYITGRGASLRDKIVWNLVDWRARLRGRFRNELGAHAGFTMPELAALCRVIGEPVAVTRAYYERLYPRHQGAVAAVVGLGLARPVFPCFYCVGRRGQR